MKSIKKWCEEHGWLLSIVTTVITIIGDSVIDIISNETIRYIILALVFCVTLIVHIKNEPEYEFRLKDDGKPQFSRLKREPHFSLPQLEEMVRHREKKENLWGTYNKLLEKASS